MVSCRLGTQYEFVFGRDEIDELELLLIGGVTSGKL